MPETPEGVLDWVLTQTAGDGSSVCSALEQVGGYNSSEGSQPGSRMFRFGESYGWLRMALVAVKARCVLVVPQRWQRDLGIEARSKDTRYNKSRESKPAFKRRLKQHAEQLFPGTKLTLATADALLLAEWCRRQYTGQLQRQLL